jgi:lysophospholipase L1-like esterase
MQQAERVGSRIPLYATFAVVLVLLLGGMDVLMFAVKNPFQPQQRHYYLALGDSLAFGYQPNLDFADGYANQLYAALQKSGVTNLVNYACGGETTTTFIQGNCVYRYAKHDEYIGSQLDAAVAFIARHPGAVSPVTLDIGSNDVIPDFDPTTCTASASASADLATMDANLRQTILPRLQSALSAAGGPATSSLLLVNYYNPFAKACPNSTGFADTLNSHLAADAAASKVPLVDVYSAFGGDDHMTDHICAYTWVCDARYNNDFHPTTAGYNIIAQTIERALGYPGIGPSLNPMQQNNPPVQTGLTGAALKPESA